ncbi:MAG TPA: deoxyribonuclease IV [Acidimicrobiales bacterium]|nr:deoxyribonuclease IV [Acidimicrobiales bacterium]
MLVGAHVRAGADLLGALSRGELIGADVVQVFTASPRAWRATRYSPAVLAAYRQAQAAHPRVQATFCHASYLVNLATDDPDLLARSRASLTANLAIARAMGSSGVVLHVGSHKGAGLAACLPRIVDALAEALATAVPPEPGSSSCPVLLENAAGAGGTVGRTFEELAQILAAAPAGADLGVCLDTQHLWASGIGFATPEEADRLVERFDKVVGLDRLCCLHLNDSKVPFGAGRDRHENVGAGTIGEAALGALLGHPALAGLPVILEVPGAGAGPRAEDVAAARRVIANGAAARARSRGAVQGGRPPRRLHPASATSHAGPAEKERT